MHTATTIAEARRWRAEAREPVGLVPTMGFLHAGHLSLVEHARRDNARIVVSIFVNPTQFGPHEDLARYPRDFDRDRALVEEAGCDLLFAPTVDEMYPAGFQTRVEAGAIATPLEGARRPGHFSGVATVVLKLFGIFAPDRAYFGQKDAQQLAVIRRVTRDLDQPVQIVACETVRQPDGLALSSRNSYLTPDQRSAAPVLYRALCAARERYQSGERSAAVLRSVMQDVLAQEPQARPEYVSVADQGSLEEVQNAGGAVLLSLAVHIGQTRLIDNIRLEPTDGRP